MDRGSVDRRRGKRANLEVPLSIRRVEADRSKPFKEEVTKNISLVGLYFETEHGGAYSPDDVFMASASIPELHTREFPFTRVAGPSRVVRVSPLPGSGEGQATRFGVALEFGQDVIALSALPRR